jgi:hypothetical protein
MMLAQRYPEAYDGIAASAPAFNFARLMPSIAWPQVMMNLIGQFPSVCEFNALTAGAIAACDSLDGVTDGLISDPAACSFDPFTMVGKTVSCDNKTTIISNGAATIANLTWDGPEKPMENPFIMVSPTKLYLVAEEIQPLVELWAQR